MTTLKDGLNKLQTLEQHRQELLQALSELEQQQEKLARFILTLPNCPHETYVSIDPKTVAWVDHSDNWEDDSLRSAIKFHELTQIDFEQDDNETSEESNPYLLSGEELEQAENQLYR